MHGCTKTVPMKIHRYINMDKITKTIIYPLFASLLFISACSSGTNEASIDQTADTSLTPAQDNNTQTQDNNTQTNESNVATANQAAPTATQSTSGDMSPTANAGPDQYKVDTDGNNTESISLNGSGSTDPDNNIDIYKWRKNGTLLATGKNATVPLNVGTHRIYLTVIDTDGNADFDAVDITVAEGGTTPPPPTQNQAPVVNNPNSNQTATVGTTFNYNATQNNSTFSDPDGDNLTYSLSLTPGNLGLNPQNGSISGTPTSAGTVSVVIAANDGQGGTVSDQFNIVIANAQNTPPPPGNTGGSSSNAPTGKVRFWQSVKSEFDSVISNANAATRSWMADHYDRMMTFSTFFDSHTSWFPGAWEYENLYGQKPSSSVATNNPDWVLRDVNGNALYIPFTCSNGSCTRYAMDFGNPAFRNWWINQMRATMGRGNYRGIYLDDVNMTWRISNGNGVSRTPIDPRTGSEMTLDNWRKYLAQFVEQINNAFPDKEITHNTIWFAGETSDPYIRRQIDAADYIHLERGFMDNGLRGQGKFSLENFHAFIDFLHNRGKKFIAYGKAETTKDREYDLANYFLMNTGDDLLGERNQNWTKPTNWWSGFDVQLGAALGSRYVWNGAIRRDFENGMVLVNPPDRADLVLSLDNSYQRLNGATINNIVLTAKQGAVLKK